MFNKRRAEFLIEQELSHFPKATMTDIYKLFYQNCCGSGHFISDLTYVKDNIKAEITTINPNAFNYPDYDISYIFQIKRISLYSIMVGKYDLNFIADKFWELSLTPLKLTSDQWIKEWKEISRLIKEIKPYIFDDLVSKDFDQASSLHHSDIYRINYNPHYRICNL
ncbi:hypothetical protein JEZ13_07455 [bacterium]|nr:hypothetical protein [bacterium]